MQSTGEGGGRRGKSLAGSRRVKTKWGPSSSPTFCFEWSCKRVQKLVDEVFFA